MNLKRKTFGRKANRTRPERVEFDFVVMRDDDEEVHTFGALPRLDAAGLAGLFLQMQRKPEVAMGGLIAAIAKNLDNSDGVPAKWEPMIHNQRAREQAQRKADAGEDVEVPDAMFRAPSGPDAGNLVPMARTEEFLEFEAGSSRRRFLELMDPTNEDVLVEQEALTGAFEWLVGLASARPTERSSS